MTCILALDNDYMKKMLFSRCSVSWTAKIRFF